MGNLHRIFVIFVGCLFSIHSAISAETTSATTPKLLDGVVVEAIENYWNPKQNEINLGLGVYPFNAYYTGVCLTGGYTYHSSRNFSWEILNASYFSTFDKGLTTELADRYNVNPNVIERAQYIISTNLDYVLSYGKFVFLEDFIRYFRASGILGLAVVGTSAQTYFAPDLGLKFEILTGKTFSWRFEVRDAFALGNATNYVTFTLGTGFSF